jgi:hypothetical protein
MVSFADLDVLYFVTAFLLQAVLIIHFALRKWRFDTAIRYDSLVYALCAPAASTSVFLVTGGETCWLWPGGFIHLLWALFAYTVEYVKGTDWRTGFRWSILGPYVCLYLATVMFYWWPLA